MAEIHVIIGDESTLRDRMMYVWKMVCGGLKRGPVTVTLGRPKRSGDQNRHFHALIGEIAKQVKPDGRGFTAEIWKALLVDQFEEERKAMGEPLSKPGQVVPSRDGRRVVSVRPSTAGFTKREAADFIEYLYSEGVQMGVTFSPPSVEIYEQYKEGQ